jgi:ATP-dependent DNA helicase RecG
LPAELLETAARIFRAEAQDGYRDRIVIGGLSGFVEKLRAIGGDQAANLLKDYGALAPEERELRLKQAQTVLGGTPPAPPKRATPPPPPTPPRAIPQSPPPGVTLSTPIQSLKGVGPVRARLYTKLGIRTVNDLLFHFPARHQSFPPATPISALFFQAEGSVLGTLERLEVESLPRGLRRLKATVKDQSGTVYAVWLRHGVARLSVQVGEQIALSGKLIQQGRLLILDNPEYERGDSPPVHTRGLVPIYSLTAGLTELELRRRIHWAVTHFAGRVDDPLPESVRALHHLLPIDAALRQLHYPRTPDEYAEARRRFALEELMTIQLMVLKRRMSWQEDPAVALPAQPEALAALESGLPFELTRAQRRVTDEILHDMALHKPMTRLLQG